MKQIIILISLISLLSFSNAIPHFTFDGLESYHESLGETNKITFTIYGSLSEELNPEKMYVENYLIEDMGEFKCFLLNNVDSDDEKRTHKIQCVIIGNFERRGYILDEPKVYGFDFNDENGKTTWPEQAEKKTFLIGEIGEKIELNGEPLLLGDYGEYVNPLNKVRKDVVDKALISLPLRSSVDLARMTTSMKSAKTNYGLTQGETAYMVYKWEGQNIVYDCYNFNHNRKLIDYSAEGTYMNGKGVCDGYAKVFLNMTTSLGLECQRVVGYSKGSSYAQGRKPTATDHAWNAVKIDGKYYLVDATWGSGSCDGDSYKPGFKDSYFCTDPKIFVRGHLPADSQWQLMSPLITLDEFINMLSISMDFYSYGFKTIYPDTQTFTAKEKFTVNMTYGSDTAKTFLIHLYYLNTAENIYREEPNSCWINKQPTYAVLTCFTNYQGQYKLTIYGGPDGLKTYPQFVDYIIYSNVSAINPKGFPEAYGSSDVQITEPLYNPLKRGRMMKFNLKTSKFNNLYITNKAKNTNHFRELDNKGNGVFVGEDVYIFGQEVYISTLENNYYTHLVKYTTIRDSDSVIDATFPVSYGGTKNILYSPLLSTLQKGKTYNFKIKCEGVSEIFVIDGNNFIPLTKNGDIFTGKIQIIGYTGQVKISYTNGNYYYTIYAYQTTN